MEDPVDARRMSKRPNQAHSETANNLFGKLAKVFTFPKVNAQPALMAA